MMLNNAEHPVAWAMLLYELSDAHEHFGKLIDQMTAKGAIDEEDFRIQLAHVYSHLNRAWHGRSDTELDQVPDELRALRSMFPVDMKPVFT